MIWHEAIWQRASDWVRDHPTYADLLVALTVMIGQVGATAAVGPVGSEQEAGVFAYSLVIVSSLLLVGRRIRPLEVVSVSTFLTVVFWVSDYAGTIDFSMWLAFLSATAYGGYDRRHVWRVTGTCIAVASITAVVGVIVPSEDLPPAAVPAVVVFQGTAAAIGEAAFQRRQKIELLEQRASALESDLDTKARLAALDERARIAREMHDIIAHGMSAVVVQAGAARRVMDTNPDAASEALGNIEKIGRDSVDEMRRMLGLLRDERRGIDLEPQPSFDDYHELIARARDAGVDASFEIRGNQRPLPPGLELTGFRIVQEALTNVIRHAGRPVTARVSVSYGDANVVVEVVDDGLGAAASSSTNGTGHGLLGMSERADVYGGSVHARPRPGGGFGVTATLPIPAASTRAGGAA
ncbi:MAG: sensor histidine kinase [Acidimicrobiales bacterium]|nr:sensor histidine kinase [Acidimicrobiales bacterium]